MGGYSFLLNNSVGFLAELLLSSTCTFQIVHFPLKMTTMASYAADISAVTEIYVAKLIVA